MDPTVGGIHFETWILWSYMLLKLEAWILKHGFRGTVAGRCCEVSVTVA